MPLMPEPLKNIYNPLFFEGLTEVLKTVLPRFKKQAFINQVIDAGWEEKELKQRMRHISTVLVNYLPNDFSEQVACTVRIIEQLESRGIKGGFEYMFLPDLVEQCGLDHLHLSLRAMERITQFASCEFAVRPFLSKYPEQVMQQMLRWSKHPHHHVRRFASEGCRPRLPWAMAIPGLKNDPSPIIPVLENLKTDDSLFVRKSVANNLNDIAKDHPGLVAGLVKSWKGKSRETDWIIRHGCRTLLKKADPAIYEIFGLNGSSECKITGLKLNRINIKLGETLPFSFQLKTGRHPANLRIEYAVYYLKANGSHSRKIFQLTQKNSTGGEVYSFKKEQRFQDFSTRKHYPGRHKIAVVVNGRELAAKEFTLLKN